MTRLIKLTLKNFKSFKKAEIPISKGFTAIVGSNGSGKSNILDGLLFVLGITSLKTLRAGKLTDLVNNDARESYAKVDLLIKDNEKQYEVSRMIDKQGKSVYRLDGKRTTLNEISSLLTDLGIDVTGHNIVTQGDITKIIEMSPIQRREVIDNIAGLSEFDEKKNEAIKELDKVDSKIKEATIILNERNTFLTELESEMKTAKEFKDLEEERKRTKATIISKELYTLEKKTLEADNEIAEMEKQKQIVEERIASIRKELDEAKSKSDEIGKEMIKSSEQTYSTIGRAFEETKAKLMVEQEKVDLKKGQVTKNNEKIELNKAILKQAEKERKELIEKQKKLQSELKEIEEKLKESTKKKSAVEEVVKAKNVDLGKEENALELISKEIENARKESFDLEVFARNWEKQKAFNEKKLTELTNEEKGLLEEIEEIENKKEQILGHSSKNPQKELEELESQLNKLFEEKNLFGAKKSHEEKSINELKKALSLCPVCDSDLKEDKKLRLIQQKEELIKEFAKKEGQHDALLGEIKHKIAQEKEKIMIIARLQAETAHEEGVKHKLGEVKKNVAQVKTELDSKAFDAQLLKRNKLAEKMKTLVEEMNTLKEKVSLLRKQNVFEEYSQINKTHEELIHKRSSADNALNESNSKLESIKTREENASVENNNLLIEVELIEKEVAEKEAAIKEIKENVLAKEKELITAKKKNVALGEEKEKVDKNKEKFEKEIINESFKTKKIEGRVNEWNIEKSKLGVRQADLTEESKEFIGIEPYSSKTLEECKEKLVSVERRLGEIGNVNMKAVDNFNELKTEVEDIQQKANKLSEERLAVLDMIDKIEVKRTNVFMECFNEINTNFKNIFFKFFHGEGNLNLSDPIKPLESGLMVDAKHKAGKLLNIDSMSGGEKTLTALAFMFAIQLYRPAPFYAFDEADAALDKENSLKMGNLIEMIAEKSQFIAVTHNDVITKKAAQIIGVARGKDDSSVIGLKLKNSKDDELKEAKPNAQIDEAEALEDAA
ncbi:MAG: AAA family ATPase [archaeon]|jgi:chromosome segregation protein